MRGIGFFREFELHAGPSAQSIHSAVEKLTYVQSAAVVAYLEAGVPILDVMGATRDPLDAGVVISGGPSLISDGEWVWRKDLAYYVEKYRVGLPEEFVNKAMSQDNPALDANAIVREKGDEIIQAFFSSKKGII